MCLLKTTNNDPQNCWFLCTVSGLNTLACTYLLVVMKVTENSFQMSTSLQLHLYKLPIWNQKHSVSKWLLKNWKWNALLWCNHAYGSGHFSIFPKKIVITVPKYLKAKMGEKGFRFALMSCVSTSSEFLPRKPQIPQKSHFKRLGWFFNQNQSIFKQMQMVSLSKFGFPWPSPSFP